MPFLITFTFLMLGILDLSQDPFDISKANALRFCNGGCQEKDTPPTPNRVISVTS